MPKSNAKLLAFNRGEVSRHALARVDLERLQLSAETQVNYMPTVLGPMMLRPGLAYIVSTKSNNTARYIPFIFGKDDTALIEFTDGVARVLVDDTLVTRNAVSTTIANGTFATSASWTQVLSAGSTASFGTSGLTLTATARGGSAMVRQLVGVASGDRNVEHAIRVTVERGPVLLRLSHAAGGDDLIAQTTLDTGVHSLAFTPIADFYIEIESRVRCQVIVTSVAIEAAGVMELPSPFAAANLPFIRHDQSGDIIFIGCYGSQQRKIERRALRSWSLVLYQVNDGPFQAAASDTLALTPGAHDGNTTLSASRGFFKTSHVGSLFRLFSTGQTAQAILGAANAYTDAIRVTGVGSNRNFNWTVTGTWSGTLTLERSFDGADSGFIEVADETLNGSYSVTDGLDNSVVWYRVGFKTGEYASGTATVAFDYTGGGGPGICRVTEWVSSTQVNIEVLNSFSSLAPTEDWLEGDWSDRQGWPSAVAFVEGRLGWFGRDRSWLSVSDSYYSFDLDVEGDSGPVVRSFGSGPVEVINGALALGRLIVFREMSEASIRSSAQDEPLSPTNWNVKNCSTQGSAHLAPAKIDTKAVFVQQSGRKVYELRYLLELQDYAPRDLTRLNIDIGLPGFVDLDVQRQPDTMLHLPRGDGQCAVLLYESDDEVAAWWRLVSDGADGEIEDVVVLPGDIEDDAYYVVKRTINGATKRYLEKMARRDQCLGQPEARCADSHVIYSGAATTTITGLSHLEGEEVVCWGWNTASPFTITLPNASAVTIGKDFGTFTVSGGQITGLSEAVTDACVGLAYTAQFKSTKLAYSAAMGTALAQVKKIDRLGLVLLDTHAQGLEYGQSFDVMDALPQVEEGMVVNEDTVWPDYDNPMFALPGEWSTDSRLCLRSQAPRPCTVAGVVVTVTTHESG